LIRGINHPSSENVFMDLAQHDGASREIRQQANIRVWQSTVSGRLNGPAKLTKFLKIDNRFNAKPTNRKTGLWIEDRGIKIAPSKILRTPRIGVDYAGNWAKKPFRLLI